MLPFFAFCFFVFCLLSLCNIHPLQNNISPGHFEQADDFYLGLAQIKTNGELCMVGKDGKIVWSPTSGSRGG